jgi:voltage-gated potassium channel
LTLEESRLLRLLPPELAADVALCMHRDLLRKVPLFRNADAEFIRDIVQKLVPLVVMPGAYFIRRGEVGDHMYFIGEGVVEVVADDSEDVFATLGPGDFVGETALVRDIPRTASVRARGYCDLYVLSRQDFDECLRAHPVFARHIRDVAAERERERRNRGSG